MQTTVTGIFSNHSAAQAAVAGLASIGFASAQVRIIDQRSVDLHSFISSHSADVRRATLLGLAFGGIAGAAGGIGLANEFGLLLGGSVGLLLGALGGALLGGWIGHTTTDQIRDQLEQRVQAGSVLVGVQTEPRRRKAVLRVLVEGGGSSIVASLTSFAAGVVAPGAGAVVAPARVPSARRPTATRRTRRT